MASCGMAPDTLLAPLAAVLLGNGMTFAFVYCMWRLKQNPDSLKPIFGGLALIVPALLVFLSLSH